MHKIYKLKEMLMEELKVLGSKDKLDQSSLELTDKLAHAIKNIDKIIECEEEKEEREYSYENSMRRGGSYGGGSYGEGSYGSYARGGGRGGRGGSRAGGGGGSSRYSRNNEDWYSSDDNNIRMELQELMNEAPNEQFRQKIQRMMNNM